MLYFEINKKNGDLIYFSEILEHIVKIYIKCIFRF